MFHAQTQQPCRACICESTDGRNGRGEGTLFISFSVVHC